MRSQDVAIEREDLDFDRLKLRAERYETIASYVRHTIIIAIGHDLQKRFNAVPPYPCNNAKFSQVRTDYIDQRRSLAHE